MPIPTLTKSKVHDVVAHWCDEINRYTRTDNEQMRRYATQQLGDWIDANAGGFVAYARCAAVARGVVVR